MKNLKTIRLQRGLTQEKLAEALHVGQCTIACWESGDKHPRADKLPDLARVLSCTIDDLYADAERAAG